MKRLSLSLVAVMLSWDAVAFANEPEARSCGYPKYFTQGTSNVVTKFNGQSLSHALEIVFTRFRMYNGDGGSLMISAPVLGHRGAALTGSRVAKVKAALTFLGYSITDARVLYIYAPYNDAPIVNVQYCKLPRCGCDIPESVISKFDMRDASLNK